LGPGGDGQLARSLYRILGATTGVSGPEGRGAGAGAWHILFDCIEFSSLSWVIDSGTDHTLMAKQPGIDLAFDRLNGQHPRQAVAFLHGILGRGINLRMIARRFIEPRPDWTAWLVDLRGHGRSPKSTPAPSLEAAAWDVVNLAARAELPLSAIVGHSFGGKVALEAARLGVLKSLHHIVVIDSAPGSTALPRGGDSPLDVIDVFDSLPREFESKSDFIRAVVAAGKTRALAEWLAGSLERENNHVRLSLDLDEIRALITDYFTRDLWPVVEHPPAGVSVHLIIAESSGSFSSADRKRAFYIAAASSQVTVDILPGGHWLHVDNPDGALGKLLEYVAKG
jgi:pimeloyl-ACP methyl ester carboxylesterase